MKILYFCIYSFFLSLPAHAYTEAIETAENAPLVIYAASSLQEVLTEQAGNWARDTGQPAPKLSFAGSAIAARQISLGAKADIFISANEKWVAYLAGKKAIQSHIQLIAHNQLVFAVPKQPQAHLLQALTLSDILAHSKGRPIAIANPSTAPAGEYTKKFLNHINAWDNLSSGKLAFSPNVRRTLALIEQGGLSGFVYASDAKASKKVQVIYTVPTSDIGVINYYGVVTNSAPNSAITFLKYLQSDAGGKTWASYGFINTRTND